jgi:hypothetical protein
MRGLHCDISVVCRRDSVQEDLADQPIRIIEIYRCSRLSSDCDAKTLTSGVLGHLPSLWDPCLSIATP